MSGDVQPRKRKDKKKKKDDLGVEEPRGTAAAFGEGDVFMHSHSEHSTGGHWCAKVIFFSLLAVLITLIGLIILENRGLTELEANSVESRYSGVLEGWIEDAADDDHHDEHTLELKHHDEDEADHGSELEHDDDDEEIDEHSHEDDEDENDDDNDDDDQNDNEETDQDADESEEADNDDDDVDEEGQESEEQNLETADDEDDIEEASYRKYYNSNDKENENDDDGDDDDEDDQKRESNEQHVKTENHQDDDNGDDHDDDDDDDDDDENHQDDDDNKESDSRLLEKESEEDKTLENNDDDDDDDSNETDDYQNDATREEEDEHEHEEEEPANIEIERIEKEVSDDDAVSTEEPAFKEDDEEQNLDVSEELSPTEDDSSVEDDDVEFLEPDELDELPIIEPITAPKGKPLSEVEESPSTEKPQDTLADEEEYERQQEELRKEREQASQGMWLKLTVGGALLVATHAVLRRATASRETDTEEEEAEFREETPLSDRRMTLITDPVPPPTVAPKLPQVSQPIESEVKRESSISWSSPPAKEEIEDEEEEIIVSKPAIPVPKETIDKELYSDEEDIEEEVEDEEEETFEPIKATPQQAVPQTQTIPDVTKEVTPEPDEDDDVEIIDEEELEEEEISDVDDAELLSRLEEKYGRLPEPDRRAQKDGGNSIEDEWPGEPEDAFWNEQLEQAQRELRQGDWTAAVEKANSPGLQASARARYIAARALDIAAEAKKDNQLLNKAIAAYLELLKMNEILSDKKLLEVASRTLDRIKFRGTYLSAEPIYKLLIRRFPKDPGYRNNLTISLLMANRADLAEEVLEETLKLWPNDRIALAHHGFILKTLHNRLEEAVEAFTKALEGDIGAANEPRFYYHLGDALLILGRFQEAHEVHKRGAKLGHFLSPYQRSLYNVDRLKSKPWWNIDLTPYSRIARALENSWKDILKEGEAAKAIYEKEKEGLKDRGEWSQLDLFIRGREVPNRCVRAPVTCGIVKSEIAASGCRRGQIKFSMMEAGTHVRPHVGPTNCRLRMHLGLSNTKDTFIRVDREIRQWQTGKVLMFDDSFEHEVWHNGTGTRLVLIVDVWHPDLTPAERRQLPAI